MDPVRFGRALGTGARLAAKTAVTVVDAALAPNPNAAPSASTGDDPPPAARTAAREQSAAPAPPQTSTGAATTPLRSKPQSVRHLARALSSPVRRLSGVLWLEITGLFFGLFALSTAIGAWRLRDAWRSPSDASSGHTHILVIAGVALLFAYFSASSFFRAHRRSRQP